MTRSFAFACLLTIVTTGLPNAVCLSAADATEGLREPTTAEIGGQSVPLAEPILTGSAKTEGQQQQLVEPFLRGLSFGQFTRDSVVAPVRIYLRYIKDGAGRRVGHDVHLLFVVHENLAALEGDGLSESILDEQEGDDRQGFTPADPETLRNLGIKKVDDRTRYGRLRMELLDRIKLDLLVRFTRSASDNQNRIDLSLVEPFDNRWESLEDPQRSGSYSGLRGWLTATSLVGLDAVLIESRFVFHEPEAWFQGSNFVRSKLPLVLQEAARDLRRRLNAKRPVD